METSRWWGPYLGVALCAALAALIVVAFVALQAAEIATVIGLTRR